MAYRKRIDGTPHIYMDAADFRDIVQFKVIAIVASDPLGVIGSDGKIPWHYKADFKRFKERTMGGALIMGRKTFESIPEPKSGVALPGRSVIVVTHDPSSVLSTRPDHVTTSVEAAVQDARNGLSDTGFVWICGGAGVYREAIQLGVVDEIDYTLVPIVPFEKLGGNVVYFGEELLAGFKLVDEVTNPDDAQLVHRRYVRA